MNSIKNKHLFIGAIVLLLVGLPVGIYLSQKNQEVRSRASASTTLSMSPESSASNPIKKIVGDTVSFDVIINPGQNLPSVVKMIVLFDPAKFGPKQNVSVFSVNTSAFPRSIEGPVVGNGSVSVTVSVGTERINAISKPTKVGTLTLLATSPTGSSPAMITFGGNSEVLSIASTDSSTENVLATTVPGYITIEQPTPTPTPTSARKMTSLVCNPMAISLKDNAQPLTATLSDANGASLSGRPVTWSASNPNAEVSPMLSETNEEGKANVTTWTSLYYPTPFTTTITAQFEGDEVYNQATCTIQATYAPLSASPTPTITSGLSFSVLMHGIGGSGDNTNETASSFSNKNPQHPVKPFKVFIADLNNQEIASLSGLLLYASASGVFNGTVPLPDSFASGSGQYFVKVKSSGHLRRSIVGVPSIVGGQINVMPTVSLITGDVNDDNVLDIRDYSLLIGCYSDLQAAKSCDNTTKLLTDLNDDGAVNQIDYNLFVREIAVQAGN